MIIDTEPIFAWLDCGVFLGGLLLVELSVRKYGLSTKITRRVAHVCSGLFGIFMWSQFSATVFLWCLAALIAVISASYTRRLLRSVHNVDRKTYGEIYLPIGILLAYLMAAGRPNIFIAVILIASFADVTAGIISELRNQGRASRLGSVGFFIVSVAILVWFSQPLADALVIAFTVTMVERISPYGSDNLTIPIAASVLLLL